MTTEKNWENIFAYDQPAPNEEPKNTKCRCGNQNCQTAKKIKCVCGCHSANHGIKNREGMEPLDKALGLDKPEIEFPVEPPTPEELAVW